MTNPKIYVGTIGADLEILSHADLVTGVSSVVINVRTPGGREVTWTPDSSDATGVISYRLQPGDLDEAGTYSLQPVANMTDGAVWPLGAAEWYVYRRFEVQ